MLTSSAEAIMQKRYHKYRDDGTGNIFEKNGAFHVRWWYVNDAGERKQRSKKICDKSRDCASTRSKCVLELAAETLQRERGVERKARPNDPTIVEFYDAVYLPFQEKSLRPSSLHSLHQIWNQHLKTYFGATKLNAYQTFMASQFLTELASKYSSNTIAHVRSTMSGVFAHALNLGSISSNPMRDVKIMGKKKPMRPTRHYSLEELENIVTALVDEPELQLVVGLSGFAGLRPGEIIALKFGDFDHDQVHVRRAVGRSVVGDPKTETSVRSVPLVAPVKLAFHAWKAKRGIVTNDDWVFPGRFKDRPGVMSARTRAIKEIIDTKKLPWKTLYAGRRGAATILTQLTGNPLAAAQLLGHKDYSITMAAYVKQDRRALDDGMKLLESKLK